MLHDYKCKNCNHIQEEYVRQSSIFVYKCNECGHDEGDKVFSSPAKIGLPDDPSTFFLGGAITKMDTLNGRLRTKWQNKIYSGT